MKSNHHGWIVRWLLTSIFLVAIVAVWLRKEIMLLIYEQEGAVEIYSSRGITLPQVCLENYSKIYVSEYINGHYRSSELCSLSEEGRACVTNWLLGSHTKALLSLSDFAPQVKISCWIKPSAPKGCLAIVNFVGDFVIYEYGSAQFLRFVSDADRQMVRSIILELEKHSEEE